MNIRRKKNWMYIHLATLPKVLSPPHLPYTLGHPQPGPSPTDTPNTPAQIRLQGGPQHGKKSISDDPERNYQIKRRGAKTVSLPLNSSKQQPPAKSGGVTAEPNPKHAHHEPRPERGAKSKPEPKHTHPRPQPGRAESPRNPDPNTNTTQQ